MKHLILLFTMWVVCIVANSQSIGSKVSLVGVDGKNYTGNITRIQGGKYFVKYDGYDFTAWLTSDQFVVSNTQAAAPIIRQNKNQVEAKQQTTAQKTSSLYIGEYATYGYGGGLHLIAGMGFTLLPGGRYYDLDKGRGGSYVYNPGNATISFKNGFLDGQVGKKVNQGGFWLTETVACEPWK